MHRHPEFNPQGEPGSGAAVCHRVAFIHAGQPDSP